MLKGFCRKMTISSKGANPCVDKSVFSTFVEVMTVCAKQLVRLFDTLNNFCNNCHSDTKCNTR